MADVGCPQRSRRIATNLESVDPWNVPDAATIDYGVAKAGVVNLSESLAQEFGRTTEHHDVPAAEISVADLMQQLREARSKNNMADGIDADLRAGESMLVRCRDDVLIF